MFERKIGWHIRAIGYEHANANRQRKKCLTQCDQDRLPGYLTEIRLKQKFDSGSKVTRHRAVNDEDQDKAIQCRHQEFRRTLDAVIHATRDYPNSHCDKCAVQGRLVNGLVDPLTKHIL